MKFFLLLLSLYFTIDVIYCQTDPNNTYNVPLLDFTDNPVNKSLLCSTPGCCAIALTFDDGPDGAGGATDAIVDFLHSINLPATFFINTENWVNVNTDLAAQKSIKNIVEYRFNLGTHTVHHKNLPDLNNTDIADEIVGVQTTLNKFMSPPPRLSLFRAPFGKPYQDDTQTHMNIVSKIAADAGYFHVSWQIDSQDYSCGNNITCVVDPILNAVDRGEWGIVLMHFVYQNTANALPSIIDGLKQRKCEFFTIEQLVHAKYGKSSADVMDDYNRKSKATTATSSAFLLIIFIFSKFLF
ncbi:unnamed protein product [Adineta ricciae]|uniref:NodB homology domain-containing protein n=1 Tax=Adineta ricciae TaxID=249248 RepID=A0A814NCZ0_ADIRI|nr:unnamed protein product [Adineta ricciae]CAF1412081.1 unnamed protein product [Adineta ricciae]